MFLNDAFDAEFDRLHRSNRPIPSGAISEASVWRWGIGWLGVGTLCLIPHSGLSAALTLLLVGSILLYDGLHKLISFSPLLMALCRCWLVLLASSFGQLGLGGLAIWSALVLGSYIVGLSYLARRESQSGAVSLWPLILLAAPLALAWIVNPGVTKGESLVLSLVLLLWILKTIMPLWTRDTPNVGHVVSGLLAGICFVDLLSVADVPRILVLVFIAFFAMALLLQRRIPAT
jgi:UbiA prenyltransferase family